MRYWCFVLISLIAGSVFAQTAADISAKGGKKLSNEESQRLIPGATVAFTTTGPSFTLSHDQAGNINGTGMGRRGSFMAGGSWKINDTGKLCQNVTTPAGNLGGCHDVYRLGEDYFFVGDDGKPMPRKISR